MIAPRGDLASIVDGSRLLKAPAGTGRNEIIQVMDLTLAVPKNGKVPYSMQGLPSLVMERETGFEPVTRHWTDRTLPG